MIPRDLPPQVQRLLGFVSPRVGIVRALTRLPRGVDEPSPPILYHAQLSNFDFKRGKPAERAAAGKGLTEAEAIAGAIGEAVERYAASHFDPGAVRRLSVAEAAAAGAIGPAECVLYSEAQYDRPGFLYPRPGPDTVVDWSTGRELTGDRDVLVPAALTYLYGAGGAPRDFFCPPTSSGLAAGPDLESAIVAGLCELAERDAFLVTWMNRLPAPEVDLAALRGPAAAIRTHYERFGLQTRVFDVTTDVAIPAMMGVSLDPSGRGPAAVVGLGCHLDPERAVLRALFEICQVRPGEARRQGEREQGRGLKEYADVRTLEDHSSFFADAERLGELSFLLHGDRRPHRAPPPRLAASAEDALRPCVEALARVGCRVAYVDLTTADVEALGVKVVRTFATGLQPIHFGHGEERLGGKRLYDVPRRLGYGHAVRTEGSLNPCPHPLA
jgi:ribosomal protein S12 methylthiotransferase accessory factor